jgi:ribosomal protein S18 acetylase RimI-like enzyme
VMITLMRIRDATLQDAQVAAALLLELPGGLRDLFADRETAAKVARGVFEAGRTVLSHRHAVIAEDEGRPVGLMVRLSGRAWHRLRLSTGLAMMRAAGPAETPGLVRRGRIQDRLIPSVDRNALYVPAVAVVPERRSQGIGSLLLLRAMGEAAELGLRSVLMDVDAENQSAIRLYRRLGFHLVSEQYVDELRKGPDLGSVRLERSLGGRR